VYFSGLIWFVVMLLPLVFIQRLLHREIQAVFLISTRNPQLTIGLFAVLFFPGVFLHELGHFLMAKLLQVSTRDFSLVPHIKPDGRVQMGYVETAQSDIVRDSLIGLAPLITGTAFLAYVGLYQLNIGLLLDMFAGAQYQQFLAGLLALPQVNDFPLWFYLAFTISSTMMPSESDRHAWLPLGLLMGLLVVIALLAGAGPWMMQVLAPFMDELLGTVAILFGLSIALHGLLLLPTWILHRLASRLSGVDVISAN
jgi:hypothetical protein